METFKMYKLHVNQNHLKDKNRLTIDNYRK